MMLWHARPHGRRVMTTGFHAGTFAQAQMRHPRGEMMLVELWPDIPAKRIKDAGTWSEGSYNVSKSSAPALVYLNRYEGIGVESAQRIAAEVKNADRLTDAQFLKYAPDARDSYIVLDPSWIKTLREALPGEIGSELERLGKENP